MFVEQRSEYRVVFRGYDSGIHVDSLAGALKYIDGGVEQGNARDDYSIETRQVVTVSGPWETTNR